MSARLTLNTLIWQLAECRCSEYSPLSFCLKVSIWMRKGTPFSPPCLRGVNSVLMQCTLEHKSREARVDGGASNDEIHFTRTHEDTYELLVYFVWDKDINLPKRCLSRQ